MLAYFLISSMLALVTRSGKVRILATWTGTATSSILRLGSGEITVRAEKLTLLPDVVPK